MYLLVKAETRALDMKKPMTSLIFQIYQTKHSSTQVESIFKMRFQILEIEIDNPAATLLSTLALLQNFPLQFLTSTIFLRFQLANVFLKVAM